VLRDAWRSLHSLAPLDVSCSKREWHESRGVAGKSTTASVCGRTGYRGRPFVHLVPLQHCEDWLLGSRLILRSGSADRGIFGSEMFSLSNSWMSFSYVPCFLFFHIRPPSFALSPRSLLCCSSRLGSLASPVEFLLACASWPRWSILLPVETTLKFSLRRYSCSPWSRCAIVVVLQNVFLLFVPWFCLSNTCIRSQFAVVLFAFQYFASISLFEGYWFLCSSLLFEYFSDLWWPFLNNMIVVDFSKLEL
jgi:hypothetical protein